MADDEEGDGAPEAGAPPIVPYTLEELKELLATFLANNPTSKLEPGAEGTIKLTNPWGDSTLLVLLAGRPDALIATLNRLLLPAKFSAVWHIATSRMEVIWTAGRLPPHQEEIVGRTFTLAHEGKEYTCSFGPSSEDLVTLAGETYPDKGASGTNLRNIATFYQYAHQNEERPRLGIDKPLSFWIEGFVGAYVEEAIVELAQKIK